MPRRPYSSTAASDPLLTAGLALLRQGQLASAERLLRERLRSSEDAAGWFHLGVAQHRLRRLAHAAESFGRAAALAGEPADALCARATVLGELGRHDEAERELRRALEASPQHAQAHHNLAVLLAARGERGDALEHYDAALNADPEHRGARINRASLRLASGEAMAALEDFTVLCHRPDAEVQARVGRVRALLLLHRDGEALQAADELVNRHPEESIAWQLKATAAASLHRLEEAQAAAARGPAPASGRTLYIHRALERQEACDWRDRERLVTTLAEAVDDGGEPGLWQPGVLMHALALPLTGAQLKRIAGHVGEQVRRAAPHAVDVPLASGSGSPRIRVGFLSPDIRVHPGAHLLRPLFRERDRERVEYVIYALNPDDGSEIRAELAASADLFVDASAIDAPSLVRRMRQDRLDVLVDRSGYFEGTRPEVTAARVAPLQVSYMGMPCSMGPGLLDYRLTDAQTIPPAHAADWWESLVHLPAPHWAYETPSPGAAGSRTDWGLPPEGFVFCCFNQPFKLGPQVFQLWLRLLRQVPGSVLWLLDPGPLARANLLRDAEAAGVSVQRLVFAPRLGLADHLGRLAHADLFLDTLHYGAHTTAADALHAGVPVLTYRGNTMASRLGATMVAAVGLPELIVESLGRYEEVALGIARTTSRAAALKDQLREARTHSPFFDVRARVQGVERAFAAIVERQRAGLAPATLTVT